MKKLAAAFVLFFALSGVATAAPAGNGGSKSLSVTCGSHTYNVTGKASWPSVYDQNPQDDPPNWYWWQHAPYPYCKDGRIYVRFHYSDFPEKEITGVTQRLTLKDHTVTKTGVDFHGSGGDDVMSIRIPRRPPPPPPPVIGTKASIHGPCGDPMYWARFNNKGSTTRVVFYFSYRAFSDGDRHTYTHSVRRGHVFTTPLFHVLGGTRMWVKAHGDILARERSAPAGNYAPCPS